MNDFDDLFKKDDKDINEIGKKPVGNVTHVDNDYFFSPKQQKINLFLFVTYVAIIFLMGAVTSIMVSTLYPNSATYKDNMQVISGPTFDIVDSNDTTNPYRVNVDSSVQNNNSVAIPRMYVKIEFFDDNGNSIGTYLDIQDEIPSGATFHSTGYVDLPSVPATNSFTYGYQYPNLFLTLIQFGQVFVTAIAYIILDFESYKKNLKDFFKNFGTRFIDIVVGFGLVWFVMYISQIILTSLGVTGTSENELTIRSMFNTNYLNLALLFLILCVLTPIVEETLFRKVIYNLIQKKSNNFWAILLSGVIFGLMHVITYGDFIQAIPYVAMGTALGYVYYMAKKNIFVTMSVHFINNFISFAFYVIMAFGLFH